MDKRKFIALVIILILAGAGIYYYYIKPYDVAKAYCNQDYVYHPSTPESGAYHTAVGVMGPVTKYESRKEAVEECTKYHVPFFRNNLDLEEYLL